MEALTIQEFQQLLEQNEDADTITETTMLRALTRIEAPANVAEALDAGIQTGWGMWY